MKIKKLNILLLLLVFTLMTIMDLPAIAGQYTPQITSEKGRDGRGRLQYANDLLSFIRRIDNQIPSLSPSQEEWLVKELAEYKKTNNIRRFIEINKTKEYKINVVKTRLSGMIIMLNAIIMKPPLKQEVYLWSRIVDALMDVELWSSLDILIEEYKVVDIETFPSDSTKKIDQYDFYLNCGTVPAQQILRNVIIPYFKQ
jgi:hypothetical protein